MTELVWALAGGCAFWVVFAYAGYPLLLGLRRRRPAPQTEDFAPSISIVITVHNAATALPAALDRMLAQAYAGPREILVASDASTDGTDEVALGYADRGVQLVRSEPRQGKESAQRAAIERAQGEILVFCDVGSELGEGALEALVRPFADAGVGSVSSEDHVESSEGEGLYVRYEMWLRRLENEITGLIGLSGSCFAARRSLCTPWPGELASDFRTALETARRGLRAVSAPTARVRIRTAADPRGEWARKVRTVRRGLAVLSAYGDLLVPGRSPVTLALWGHKVARFTSPFALLGLLVATAWLARTSPLAGGLLALQVMGYAGAAVGLIWSSACRWVLVRLLAFFVLVNASMLVAWGYHLSGRRAVTWTPTAR